MTRKEQQEYLRHLKKLGVPYKIRIAFLRAARTNLYGLPTLDCICEILDSHHITHSLENVGYDDLERYGCKYYEGCWLRDDESYLHTPYFNLIFLKDWI